MGGTILESHATGNVTGDKNVGGLMGFNLSGTGKITNCYSIGNVNGNNDVGGLVGNTDNEYNDAITSCFYDTQLSEQFDARKGKPTATEDMKKQSTYSGWDFIKVWIMNPDINDGLPYLRNIEVRK